MVIKMKDDTVILEKVLLIIKMPVDIYLNRYDRLDTPATTESIEMSSPETLIFLFFICSS